MNITFIGGGNMAGAIIGGLLARTFTPASLRVVDIDAQARGRIEQKYPGVLCYDDARKALRENDVIVLAVKPQHMRAVVARLGIGANTHLVISIAAGITLASLARWLGGYSRLVRAMPNTPALIGAGITGLYAEPAHISASDKSHTEAILGAVGATVWISAADKMDAVTAVSGSGPAYVFYFMEALEQAAQDLGLPPQTARNLALRTFAGATKLAESSSDPLSVLRERVTSKGGTTEAALKSMAADHVKAAIIRAIKAADERGRELGAELGKD